MDTTYENKVFRKNTNNSGILIPESVVEESVVEDDVKESSNNLYLVFEITKRKFYLIILSIFIIGILIGVQIGLVVSLSGFTKEATKKIQEQELTISEFKTALEESEGEVSRLSSSNKELTKTLEEKKTEYENKLSELNTRLNNIKEYESLLLSGNIEKLNLSKLNYTQKKFVCRLIPHSLKMYIEKDILPSVTIAQAIHESDWGRSKLSVDANNLFGFKKGSWKGASYNIRTGEHDSNGNKYYINASFRKYGSYEESMNDYANSMINRYKISHIGNYKNAVSRIVAGNYASDPNYYSKVVGTIEKYNLFYLDKKPS